MSHASLKHFPGVAASYDFRDKQYHICQWSGADAAGLGVSANRSLAGVVQNDPNSGDALTIGFGGVSKVVAGASIGVGSMFTCTASGRATPVTVTSGSATVALGKALEAASADGDIILAQIFDAPQLVYNV
jgi:hypothetical protein